MIYNIHYLEDEVIPKKTNFLSQKNVPENKENNGDDEGIHLVVFVHGFQGNSFDMRLIKNYVSFMYPESMFLCATSNEEMTDMDIFSMGERLALEVKEFIAENFPQETLTKISFIGHSLGGVTIRAALPKLLEFKSKFHCFMSFSSPHMGYGTNTSSVIEAGMWMLQKMKNSICLKQLSMSDHEIPEETCLYKLSQA